MGGSTSVSCHANTSMPQIHAAVRSQMTECSLVTSRAAATRLSIVSADI